MCLVVYVHIRLTLEQHGFELHGSLICWYFTIVNTVYYNTVQYLLYYSSTWSGAGWTWGCRGSDAMEDWLTIVIQGLTPTLFRGQQCFLSLSMERVYLESEIAHWQWAYLVPRSCFLNTIFQLTELGFLWELVDPRTGLEKIQDEPGASCSTRTKKVVKRSMWTCCGA